jgi:hypothetical protein
VPAPERRSWRAGCLCDFNDVATAVNQILNSSLLVPSFLLFVPMSGFQIYSAPEVRLDDIHPPPDAREVQIFQSRAEPLLLYMGLNRSFNVVYSYFQCHFKSLNDDRLFLEEWWRVCFQRQLHSFIRQRVMSQHPNCS